ncbi:conserved hypothetical protein [Ricinus communis]|uniref:Replication protein A 70 kDa DNA-binding subunit B/D first OB fold domain-containing protein n=1 Tax=Ricinus communis TaxID=3988 RepID=B9S3S4_RICCO|nr:conserved hypothetical protein [Ricinus communis]
MIDEKGDTMQGTIPKQLADHFKQLLKEGNVYHISDFMIVLAQPNYKISKHPFHIRLPRSNFVKTVDDDNLLIPFDRFDFIDFDKVIARAGDRTLLTGTQNL